MVKLLSPLIALTISALCEAQPMVEWVVPARLTNHPQTPADEEKGRTMGRAEPTPEILQPSVDPALPAYQPRKDIKISGDFTAACSDVLTRLTKLWIEAF